MIFTNQPILKEGYQLQPNFWRAPNDNDMGVNLQIKLRPWKEAMDNPILLDWTFSTTKDNKIKVEAIYNLPQVFSKLTLNYELNSHG